jgi:hypothetical protein
MKKISSASRKKITSSSKKVTFKIFMVLSFVFLMSAVIINGKWKAQAAPESTLYFDPATLAVNGDQTFSLDAKINPGTNQISAVELHVTFDPAKFRLNSLMNNATAFPQVLQAAQINNTNGTASIIVGVSLTNPPSYVTSTQTVATLSFSVIGTQGVSPINIAQSSQAAALNESVDVIIARNAAQITIGRTYGNTDFASLVVDWLQTKQSVADVNFDGKVDARDLGIMMSNWGS